MGMLYTDDDCGIFSDKVNYVRELGLGRRIYCSPLGPNVANRNLYE